MFPSLQDLSSPELVRAIDRHMSRAFSGVLCFVPDVDWHEDAEFSRLITGLPHPFANIIWNAQFDANEADARIGPALGPMRACGAPGAWIVGSTSKPAGLGDMLTAHGMFLADSMPGMALDLAKLAPPPMPPGVGIEEVNGAEPLRDWIETLSVGYELPYAVAELFSHWPLHLGYSDKSPVRAFLARQEGKGVACSMVFLDEGLAGIYCVATTPEARRQGLGAAVTAHALEAARALGYRIGVLQASKMGAAVYRRLGFEEYGVIHMYVWPGLPKDEGASNS